MIHLICSYDSIIKCNTEKNLCTFFFSVTIIHSMYSWYQLNVTMKKNSIFFSVLLSFFSVILLLKITYVTQRRGASICARGSRITGNRHSPDNGFTISAEKTILLRAKTQTNGTHIRAQHYIKNKLKWV